MGTALATKYHLNVFTGGEPVVLPVPQGAVRWLASDVYGRETSGQIIPGTTQLTPTTYQPYGWWRIGFYNSPLAAPTLNSQPMLSGNFAVIPADAHFPPIPLASAGNGPSDATGFDNVGRGCGLVPGPYRYGLDPFANDLPDSVALILANLAYDQAWYNNPDFGYTNDSVHPHPQFISYPNGNWPGYPGASPDFSALTAIAKQLAAGKPSSVLLAHEGPGSNEPQGYGPTECAAMMVLWAAAVWAGDPTAYVIGPGIVTANGNLIGWLEQYLAALPVSLKADKRFGLSIHAYNMLDGDLHLGRHCWLEAGGYKAIVDASGLVGPRWQTEAGIYTSVFGSAHWHRSASWGALSYLLPIQAGIDPGCHYCYYDTEHGYPEDPSYVEAAGQPSPAQVAYRQMLASIVHRPYVGSLDFGTNGEDLFLSLIFTNSGGSSYYFKTAGMSSADVALSVKGATTIQVEDWAGNSTIRHAENGQVTIDVTDLGTWVKVGPHVTLEVVGYLQGLASAGPDLCPQATMTSSNPNPSQGSVTNLNNGTLADSFYYYAGSPPAGAPLPYIDTALAAWVAPVWPSEQKIARLVIIGGGAPWQAQSAIYEALIKAGVSIENLLTVGQINQPAASFQFFGDDWDQPGWSGGPGQRETFAAESWVYHVKLATPVQASVIQLLCTSASAGGEADAAAADQMGQGGTPGLSLRAIRAYSA